MAAAALPRVRAPTLLLVGSRDPEVLALNEAALARLTCVKRLVVVPGASHLFEEPGTLETVAQHAARWFREHLKVRTSGAPAPL
jgi:pimeloyl-ACP methyl ester carboxylesterase